MSSGRPATVRAWYADEGWGVLDSEATPGGCWTHFSALDGYCSLSPGDRVRLEAESPGQDGWPWRAVRVVLDDDAAAPGPAVGADGAYASTLVISWDDERGAGQR